MNGGTNFAVAIQKAAQLLKSLGPNTARILVMLTDGRVDPYQGEAVSLPCYSTGASFCLAPHPSM